MDGQRSRKGAKPSNELVEADAKVANAKEEVCFFFEFQIHSYLTSSQLNLKGLGALLFDDGKF